MNILIITGGSLDINNMRNYLKNKTYSRIIAADAGLAHCKELGVEPTEILGDFDSLTHRELLAEYKEKGVPVLTFPTRKDYTDTHLAILHAKDTLAEVETAQNAGSKQNASQNSESESETSQHIVTVLAATGTRLDHTLANIGLLAQFADEKNVTAQIVDAHNTITMLKGPCEKTFEKTKDRKYISLLACSEATTGITLQGFDYPLQDATLHAFDSLGISNEILEEKGVISIKEGTLLVIQAQD